MLTVWRARVCRCVSSLLAGTARLGPRARPPRSPMWWPPQSRPQRPGASISSCSGCLRGSLPSATHGVDMGRARHSFRSVNELLPPPLLDLWCYMLGEVQQSETQGRQFI